MKMNTQKLIIVVFLYFCICSAQEYKGLLHLVLDHKVPHSAPHGTFFIAAGIALGILTTSIIKSSHLHVSPNAVLMLIAMMIGLLAHFCPSVQPYVSFAETRVDLMQAIVIPGMIFKTAFSIDAHTFLRSWMQILLISTAAFIVNAVFTGFIMRAMVDTSWSTSETVMFGTLTVPVYSQENIMILRDIGHQTKHLICLFEGESMIGLSIAIVIFRTCVIIETYADVTSEDVVVFVSWFVLMGLVCGLVLGKIVCLAIHSRFNNPLTIVLWTFVAPYITFYLCNLYGISGVISDIIMGVMVSLERPGLTSDVDQFLVHFWESIAIIVECLMVLQQGVLSTIILTHFLQVQDIPLVAVSYVVSSFARFLSILLISPILSRLEYGFTFRKMIIMVWGGLRNIVTVGAASACTDNIFGPFGIQIYTHITGMYLLTLAINGPTIKVVLKLLNMTEVSLARRSNMNTCVKYVMSRREISIAMLKMDRFLSDANWYEVQSETMIKHPYKSENQVDTEEDTIVFGFRQTICPDCQKDIVAEPSAQELRDMTREAKLRILNAQKVCYLKQYENGLLTKDGIRVLTSTVEIAIDSENKWIEIEGLVKLFTRETTIHTIRRWLLKKFFQATDSKLRMPQTRCRRWCYHLITNPLFGLTAFVVITLNVIPIVLELHFNPASRTPMRDTLVAVNTLFFLAYMFEFIVKINGYAFNSIWVDGFGTYFSMKWNIFDFIVLVGVTIDLILDYLDASYLDFSRADFKLSTVFTVLKLVRLFRVLSLVHLCKAWYPNFVKWCDSTIDGKTAFAYEIGKSFVMTQQEILEMLPQMIDYANIRDNIRRDIERDKLLITKLLGMIQKDRPWIAITVKTKQAMLSTLNTMMASVEDLKMQGWVDDFEFSKLIGSIRARIKAVKMIKTVSPTEPKVLFSEVRWMSRDKETSNILYPSATTKVFDTGDYICTEGVHSEGVFIIITGILKMSYTPTGSIVENQTLRGKLPIIDYIWCPEFDNPIEDYIVSGNTIGELGTVTNRPYDCNIVAETPSQVYIIGREIFHRAIKDCSDPVNGLESRIWKTISLKLAVSILKKIPAYQSHSVEKIKILLERAFMPQLRYFSVFIVSDMIEDIILIEGVVVDYNSKDRYVGPCYISRTVQKMILGRSNVYDMIDETPVKLLIIPAKEIDEYVLMDDEEQISEMISDAPPNIFRKLVKKRRRKRKLVHTIRKSSKSMDGSDKTGSSSLMPVDESVMTGETSHSSHPKRAPVYHDYSKNKSVSEYTVNQRISTIPEEDTDDLETTSSVK